MGWHTFATAGKPTLGGGPACEDEEGIAATGIALLFLFFAAASQCSYRRAELSQNPKNEIFQQIQPAFFTGSLGHCKVSKYSLVPFRSGCAGLHLGVCFISGSGFSRCTASSGFSSLGGGWLNLLDLASFEAASQTNKAATRKREIYNVF